MSIYETAVFIFTGAFLGMVGQLIRVVIGLKKLKERSPSENFGKDIDTKQLVISIFIGVVAGTIAALTLLGEEIDKQTLFTIVAIGYAGTDFIEGFIKKYYVSN
ncbi:MAG TPA: hypothetical protein PLS54_09945 [Syntrophomonadaceae bacterium]|nr:hypothetical protein [Syntrophomonadaceae bacterium]